MPKAPELVPQLGIVLDPDTTYEDWFTKLQKLQEAKLHWNAYVGDVVRFGRKKFGDDVVDGSLKQLEFNFTEVRKSETIGNVPIERREEFQSLGSDHFYVVGKKVEGDKGQKRMLAMAVKNKLTAKELELSIEKGEVVKLNTDQKTSGRGSGGYVTIQAAMHHVKLWQDQIGDDFKKWKVNDCKEFLDLTSDFASLREEVAMSLAETEE